MIFDCDYYETNGETTGKHGVSYWIFSCPPRVVRRHEGAPCQNYFYEAAIRVGCSRSSLELCQVSEPTREGVVIDESRGNLPANYAAQKKLIAQMFRDSSEGKAMLE